MAIVSFLLPPSPSLVPPGQKYNSQEPIITLTIIKFCSRQHFHQKNYTNDVKIHLYKDLTRMHVSIDICNEIENVFL